MLSPGRARICLLLAIFMGLSPVARGQFSTGFEPGQSSSSPGYTNNGTIIGVQDVGAKSGNVWKILYGSSSDMTLTSNGPKSGSLALQIVDSSTTSAYGAYLDLAGAPGVDFTQPFTFSFDMNLANISANTGAQVQVSLGAANADAVTNKYWAAVYYSNGKLIMYTDNGTGNANTLITLGNYSTFDPSGTSYVNVSITIDPALKKYTKVVVAGPGSTVDYTSIVQASHGGVLPWLPNASPMANPAANLCFDFGFNDTGTAKIDNIRVANTGQTFKNDQWYEAYAPGVILPDEGTLELTASFTRAIEQFGNSWDFIFQMRPAYTLGNNLMCLYIPPTSTLTPPGTSLNGMVRNTEHANYASSSTFAPVLGQKTRIAMSWSTSTVKLYVNGNQVGSTAWTIGPIAPISTRFQLQRLDPFNVSEVKVSDVQLATNRLSGNPALAMTADSNTTLLATSCLSDTQYFHTARQAALGYHSLTPQWRMEDQALTEGTIPNYTVLGINHSGTNATYSVNIQATDHATGLSALSGTWSVPIPADNTYHLTTLPLTSLTSRGSYDIHAIITPPPAKAGAAGAAPATTYDSVITLFPADELAVTDGSYSSYLGLHYPVEHYSPVVMNRMGIKTSRVWSGELNGLCWYAAQPVAGNGTSGFSWSRADNLVQRAHAAGVDLLMELGYPPRWAASDPGSPYNASYQPSSIQSGNWKPADNVAWGNYIYQVVSRYKNYVHNWEIWNEVDFHPPYPYYSFAGSTAEYAKLLQIAYTQAHLADPTCNVLTSGFNLGGDPNMPYDLLSDGSSWQYFDTFASHGYRNTHIDALNTALYAAKGNGSAHWQTEQEWFAVTDENDRLFQTVSLYMKYLEKGIGRFYQFGFREGANSFDVATLSPTIDVYVQGMFQSQMRKANAYIGKLAFTGADTFALRHSLTRTDGKILTILGQELTENYVTVAGTGSITSAVDIYGKALPLTVVGGNTVLDIANVAYIVSAAPLAITSVGLINAAPLLLNGGFENIAGDPQTSLPACTPLNWTMADKSYDPSGQINLTTSSHAGSYGMTLYSSGTGRVFVVQDVRILSAGTYQATAWFRRVNAGETAIPFLGFTIRDPGGTVTNRTFPSVVAGGAYTQVTANFVFTQPQVLAGGIMAGILSGSGTVLLDDITFTLIGSAGWQQWQTQNFGANWNDPAIAGPSVIASADGMPNLLKYALGLPAATPASAGTTLAQSGAKLTFTYQRPASRSDITYAVEVSTDLASWTTAGVTHSRTGTGDPETWQATCRAGAPSQFFRLKITKP